MKDIQYFSQESWKKTKILGKWEFLRKISFWQNVFCFLGSTQKRITVHIIKKINNILYKAQYKIFKKFLTFCAI